MRFGIWFKNQGEGEEERGCLCERESERESERVSERGILTGDEQIFKSLIGMHVHCLPGVTLIQILLLLQLDFKRGARIL